MTNNVVFIIIFSSALIQFSYSQILDFSEVNWPSQCLGNRQTPINFPPPLVNNTYFPLNNTRILFNTYTLVSGISMTQSIPNAKFAFTQPNMGDLYFQKNGYFYKYNLIEIHFHAPAEHTFNGTLYDLELHLVHFKDKTFLAFFNIKKNICCLFLKIQIKNKKKTN